MRALVTTQSNGPVAVRDVPDPIPGRRDVVISMRAASLNFGEIRGAVAAKEGFRPGWDCAGVVAQAAADGSGPAVGTRVVGWKPGTTWGELVAIPSGDVAPLPEDVTFTQAATLPAAGLSALYALRVGGPLLGKRVAVTGATGGVGRFAVQLASLAGSKVTAVVSRPERGAGLAEIGALDIRTDLPGPYDLILEAIGGSLLAQAMAAVAPKGDVVIVGNASGEHLSLDTRLFSRNAGARVHAFVLPAPPRPDFSVDLAYLAGLVASGELTPHIGLEASWHDASTTITAVLDRQVNGKAVLIFD